MAETLRKVTGYSQRDWWSMALFFQETPVYGAMASLGGQKFLWGLDCAFAG